MKEFSPFFIVGCPRSGTTLLTVLLDRHPQITIPPETHFFHTLRSDWNSQGQMTHEQLVDECVYGTHLWDMNLDRESLLERFHKIEPTYPNVFRAALEEFVTNQEGGGDEVQLIGEKTATHLESVPLILDWFPQAKILWIIRDGRDVAHGLMNHQHLHSNLRRHCHTWRRLAKIGLDLEKRYPGKIQRVHFEKLVQNPELHLQEVCHFLGVDYDPRQVDENQKSAAVLGKEMEHKGRALGKIDQGRIGVWKSAFSPKEYELVSSVLAPTLKTLNYEPTPVRPSPVNRAKHWLINLPLRMVYHSSIYWALKRRLR